jgi:Tfp pilus assembly protein PilN
MAVMLRQPIVTQRRAAPASPQRAAGWALAMAAAALLAWQVALAYQDAAQLQAHREGLAALQRTSTARASAMTAEERSRHAQIEVVAKALAAPASVLLDTIEARATPGIALKRIAFDARSGRLELDVRANSLRARQDYLRSLEQDAPSPGPRLQGLQASTTGGASKGALAFRVTARWSAASAPAGRSP